jgi:hypothetical protein
MHVSSLSCVLHTRLSHPLCFYPTNNIWRILRIIKFWSFPVTYPSWVQKYSSASWCQETSVWVLSPLWWETKLHTRINKRIIWIIRFSGKEVLDWLLHNLLYSLFELLCFYNDLIETWIILTRTQSFLPEFRNYVLTTMKHSNTRVSYCHV